MTDVLSIDPRTGQATEAVAQESSAGDVDRACSQAAHAAPALDAMGREGRARLLDAMAASLEDARDDIVLLADRETALGTVRLNGELTRTCYQLRQFAETLREGSYLQASIDHAADTAMGPRPDLRRMLVPLGPVAVFGASNFPLAFSVPGGDTAAALAAGCPVVVKGHPNHPATSLRCLEALQSACRAAGAPDGTLSLVFGQEAGVTLTLHPEVRAVGFTGSEQGGRALFDLACSRPDPIPFYGELGSLNPMVVTPGAAAEKTAEIARGLAQSLTQGAGQFCTKPGLVFLPDDPAGRLLLQRLADAVSEVPPAPLLTQSIATAFTTAVDALRDRPGLERLTPESDGPLEGYAVRPALVSVPADGLDPELLQECFGPLGVVVTYRSDTELLELLQRLPGALTGTVHRGSTEEGFPAQVAAALSQRVGRLLFDGYPTGVAVAWSMQHGGPWPAATNSLHTSVGMASISRFLRPLAWQNAPHDMLPAELRDPDPGIPRRIDGTLVLPSAD